MKVYVVGSAIHYADFLEDFKLVASPEEADVVLFTGGEDIDPSLYGCKKEPFTYSNLKRDLEEKEVFEKVKSTQLCLGICRGSQLLAALNGALIVQDVSKHAISSTHPITDGEMIYQITSTHHQMQYPYNLDSKDYTLLFRSLDRRSDHYWGSGIDVDNIIRFGEPEIVLYHKEGLPECLAVQGHPEMIPNSPVAKMISELVKDLIDDNR